MDPFIGEIIMFAGNFAPRGWAFCDGQLLAISTNPALFSILGTTYGGDGRTTFGLPDLRGRVSVHPGQGPGLSSRRLGEKAGGETVTLSVAQLPPHNHPLNATTSAAETGSPTNGLLGTFRGPAYDSDGKADTQMESTSIGNTGGGQDHDNMQPYLCVNYIIALQGIFPSRN